MNPSRVRETGRVVQKEKIQIQLKFNPGQPYRSKMATSPAPAQTSGESTKKWVLPGDRPAENVQSKPKDREAEQARPRQQPNTAARMVAVVVFARDQGDNEGEGSEGEGGPLAPEFHAAEGPRQKNQQCDHDGDHAPFQRMQCILLGLGTKSGGRTDGVALAGGGIHTPQHVPPYAAGKRGSSAAPLLGFMLWISDLMKSPFCPASPLAHPLSGWSCPRKIWRRRALPS